MKPRRGRRGVEERTSLREVTSSAVGLREPHLGCRDEQRCLRSVALLDRGLQAVDRTLQVAGPEHGDGAGVVARAQGADPGRDDVMAMRGQGLHQERRPPGVAEVTGHLGGQAHGLEPRQVPLDVGEVVGGALFPLGGGLLRPAGEQQRVGQAEPEPDEVDAIDPLGPERRGLLRQSHRVQDLGHEAHVDRLGEGELELGAELAHLVGEPVRLVQVALQEGQLGAAAGGVPRHHRLTESVGDRDHRRHDGAERLGVAGVHDHLGATEGGEELHGGVIEALADRLDLGAHAEALGERVGAAEGDDPHGQHEREVGEVA